MPLTIPPIADDYISRLNPCAIVIDCTSEAIVEQQDIINQWLHDFFVEAQNIFERTHHRFNTSVILVSNTITVDTTFQYSTLTPDDCFSRLHFHHGKGASLEEAIEKALDLLEERKQIAREYGIFCNKPRLFIISADIVNYCLSLDTSANRLHCMINDRKINFYPVIPLPPFLFNICKRDFPDGYLPTLQSPLEKVLFVSEDYWSISITDLQDDDDTSHPLTIPPSAITLTL